MTRDEAAEGLAEVLRKIQRIAAGRFHGGNVDRCYRIGLMAQDALAAHEQSRAPACENCGSTERVSHQGIGWLCVEPGQCLARCRAKIDAAKQAPATAWRREAPPLPELARQVAESLRDRYQDVCVVVHEEPPGNLHVHIGKPGNVATMACIAAQVTKAAMQCVSGDSGAVPPDTAPSPAAQVVEAARIAKHPCRECVLGACHGSRPDAPYLECDGDAGDGERCPCKCNGGGSQ